MDTKLSFVDLVQNILKLHEVEFMKLVHVLVSSALDNQNLLVKFIVVLPCLLAKLSPGLGL